MFRRSGVAAVLMGCVGFAVTLTSAHRLEPRWQVWATLVVSLCAAAGLVGAYGLASWRRLAKEHRLRWQETVLPTVVAGAGVLVVIVAGELFSKQPGSGWRGDVLVMLSMVGGGFAGAAMFGVRAAVRELPVTDSAASVVRLTELRRQLHRLASALGSLVTLSTLALGAGVLMGGTQPRELVVVFGGGGAALVGLFYAPAAVAVRAHAERLVAAVFAGSEPAGAAAAVFLPR